MRIVVGISGSSGIIYGNRLMQLLAEIGKPVTELAVIISPNAHQVAKLEKSPIEIPDEFKEYGIKDYMAPFASGSNVYDAYVVCPCSTSSLGRIATGSGDNLITRTADVFLKEKRKLIIVLRETPLSLITIKNMETVTLAGGLILPASPSFYHDPETLTDIADTVVERILDHIGVANKKVKRWGHDE